MASLTVFTVHASVSSRILLPLPSWALRERNIVTQDVVGADSRNSSSDNCLLWAKLVSLITGIDVGLASAFVEGGTFDADISSTGTSLGVIADIAEHRKHVVSFFRARSVDLTSSDNSSAAGRVRLSI